MALRFDPLLGRFVEDNDAWETRMGDAYTAYDPSAAWGAHMGDAYAAYNPGAAARPWASGMGAAQDAYSARLGEASAADKASWVAPEPNYDPPWGPDQASLDAYNARLLAMTPESYAPLSPTGTPLAPPPPYAPTPNSEELSRAKFGAARDRTAAKYNTVRSLIGPGQ